MPILQFRAFVCVCVCFIVLRFVILRLFEVCQVQQAAATLLSNKAQQATAQTWWTVLRKQKNDSINRIFIGHCILFVMTSEHPYPPHHIMGVSE